MFLVSNRMQPVTGRDHNAKLRLQKVIPVIKAGWPFKHKPTPFNSLGREIYVADGTLLKGSRSVACKVLT